MEGSNPKRGGDSSKLPITLLHLPTGAQLGKTASLCHPLSVAWDTANSANLSLSFLQPHEGRGMES